ncbi:hypothetical protein TPHA_0B04430 [Tetrapisispora phaffii CBS 4417]|uniref:Transcription factor tau 131 kDa subunit n=1 Tax=Tetrapisispora phaffii (strain ATCC 24235 / CBS 4417 / NBRC 1672 / NRRL Y-8282 / UCD 70-5) TaxID=1071381 RepID=G8BQ31_TETPH|nr:hypothetical protein TPHA_0B04430 [Tetrapisispora phaffii CBS 4417]CCE62112.1 hypothetical protein TPHA_0B04430 [Tetrapisispora phaffii CBS 4417]
MSKYNHSDIEERNDSDHEHLYENIDQLRHMVTSDSGNDDDIAVDEDESEDNMVIDMSDDDYTYNDLRRDMHDDNEEGKQEGFYESDDGNSLLREFSDYGEVEEDDDEEDFMNAIREANNFKVRRKKNKTKGKKTPSRPRREKIIDPELAQLISDANEAFVRNDLLVAEKLYNDIIKKDARNFAAYETLGDIYQLQGRLNDCCNSWFLAAHLNSSDWQFWKVVARLSADLGHKRQAIYCYSRVININADDWESLYNRSTMYKEIGQIGRALEGFQKIYHHNPFDANILRELAVLYVDYERIPDSIDLYLKVFEKNVQKRKAILSASESALESSEDEETTSDKLENEGNEESDVDIEITDEMEEEMAEYPNINWKKIYKRYKCITFDWSALNILTELYLKLPVNQQSGIKTIKRCARWIQHRELQVFWDDVLDDSEFDDRRNKNGRFDALPEVEKNKEYFLPIDIRIRLGLFRLHNDQLLEAMSHFQLLYDESFTEVADLYFEVAITLTKNEKYKEAIDFFLPLLTLEDYNNIELFRPIGKCYKETEDYANARIYYEKVIKSNLCDLDDKVALAEINYQLGNMDEFNNILLEVVELRKKETENLIKIATEDENIDIGTQNKESATNRKPKGDDVSSKPLLEDSMFRQATFRKKKTPEDVEREKAERERKITSKVVEQYNKLKLFKEDLDLGNKKQILLWVDAVSDLIDVFTSVKNFFMKSRSKRFVGIIRRTKKFNKAIDQKIDRLVKLSEGGTIVDGFPLMEERVILTSTTKLRGLTYDQWFDLFMELSLTITKFQSIEDGLSVIETAQEVNVFYQNPERVKMMRFVKLAIVLQMDNEEALTENLRSLLNQFQFNRKVLQAFMYSLSRNQTSLEILSSTVQQKFFLRQLKAFDSLRYGIYVSGQAFITNKEVINPNNKISPYLYYIYAILLYSSRGFLSALQYLNLLERELPNDPMVNLLSGLSHLHRSMQRLTPNRHFQILHGLRYIFKYYDIRSESYTDLEKQEADYNLGRAFHLIGLFSIAVQYYHKVMEAYPDPVLKKHAAYNCIIIYQESDNTELASYLMEKYLSV